MERKDIVQAILDQVLEMSRRAGGSFDENMAVEIERQIRGEYGGDEVYVPKRGPDSVAARAHALEEAKKTGRPVEAANRHGLSRSTIYRLLRKK